MALQLHLPMAYNGEKAHDSALQPMEDAMEFEWEPGFAINVSIDAASQSVLISANKAGLLSLANHLRALATEEAPAHFHLDKWNSLEDGSCELIVEQI